MSYMLAMVRVASAFLGALLISVAVAVLVIALPIWIAAFTYGWQTMLDAPGHDGALAVITMIFTVPLALVLSLALLPYLAIVFYRGMHRLSLGDPTPREKLNKNRVFPGHIAP